MITITPLLSIEILELTVVVFVRTFRHCRVKHVQTYTPVMLNRNGPSQAGDEDPQYSRKGNVSGADICWNILNHLDDGVLSENYDGMFPKQPDLPTVWEHMWPITVIELGDGFVIGNERVVTKASGTFVAPAGTRGHTLYLYEQCLLVRTATAEKGIDGGSVAVEDGKVAISLKPGQQAVIVWGRLKTDDRRASAAVPVSLPLLFMSPDDLVNPWGKQTLVAPDSEDVTDRVCPAAGCDLTHAGLQQMMVGGMMAPNPLRPEAGVEIFFSAQCELDVYNATAPVLPGWDKSVYFMTTRDFVTYSPAIRVASINRFVISPSWNKTFLSPHSCMAKSIARSHSGSKYVILSICADEGIRPMVADGPLVLDSFTAPFINFRYIVCNLLF